MVYNFNTVLKFPIPFHFSRHRRVFKFTLFEPRYLQGWCEWILLSLPTRFQRIQMSTKARARLVKSNQKPTFQFKHWTPNSRYVFLTFTTCIFKNKIWRWILAWKYWTFIWKLRVCRYIHMFIFYRIYSGIPFKSYLGITRVPG